MAIENPPFIDIYRFIDDFPIETCICSVFSIATFDYQRVPVSSSTEWGGLCLE
jgi:hypothetical protein